jgi:hypothetical protein
LRFLLAGWTGIACRDITPALLALYKLNRLPGLTVPAGTFIYIQRTQTGWTSLQGGNRLQFRQNGDDEYDKWEKKTEQKPERNVAPFYRRNNSADNSCYDLKDNELTHIPEFSFPVYFTNTNTITQ